MEVRTVLLDAGNTLIELDYRAVSDLFLAEGIVASPGQIREAAGRVRPAVDRFLGGERASTESDDVRSLWLSLVLDALGAAKPPARRRIGRKLAETLGDLWTEATEGARDTLEILRARGMGIGVVSNSDGRIAHFLELTGLRPFVDVIVDSGVEGVEKPDPRIFTIALARLGARPETAIHVGDLPAVDVAGARASGVTPVLIDPYDGFPNLEIFRIRTLPELPPLLDLMSPPTPEDDSG